MEDEMLRVKIVGANVNLEEVVTGVVCALKGKKLDNGSFEVNIYEISIYGLCDCLIIK